MTMSAILHSLLQIQAERNEEIEKDNLTLLKKMDHIMKHKGAIDHINTYRHHRYTIICHEAD